MTELIQAAKEYGLPMAMVIFFIYWSYLREKVLDARMKEITDYVRDSLSKQLERNTVALVENTQSNKDLKDELVKKPCLLEHQK